LNELLSEETKVYTITPDIVTTTTTTTTTEEEKTKQKKVNFTIFVKIWQNDWFQALNLYCFP
jgi:hypothetical protein